jgi:hypothetical protein
VLTWSSIVLSNHLEAGNQHRPSHHDRLGFKFCAKLYFYSSCRKPLRWI